MDSNLKHNPSSFMRIQGHVVVWTRLFGFLDSALGLALILFPAAVLSLMRHAEAAQPMLLARMFGVIFFIVGNLYFFFLMESRRGESYEPLRQVWLVTALFHLCITLVVGCLIFWGGAAVWGVIFSVVTAFIGAWQLSVILVGKFPNC